MDCNRIPAPRLWDDETPEKLGQYRVHIRFCSACRAKVLSEAPEKLLFDLQDDSLPEEFWLGFWNSVDRKSSSIRTPAARASLRAAAATRWIAVLIIGFFIVIYGRTLPETDPVKQVRTSDYPVIESIRNPEARYYILQTSKDQKVVMVFDPGMEL